MRPLFVQWLERQGLPDWLAPTYWLMVTSAVVVAALLTLWLWRREGRETQTASDLLFWGILGLFAGTKVFYFLQYGFPEDFRHWWHPQGFALYGGLAGLLAAWGLYNWLRPVPLLPFLDTVTPGLALGLAIGRLGCFLAGCNGGVVSNLPWAVRFPEGSSVYRQQVRQGFIEGREALSLPVHPTQLYEALFGIVSFLLLLYLWRQPRREGEVFFSGMLWYAVYRFAGEFLRNDAGGWHPLGVLTFSQFVSLLLAAASLCWLWFSRDARQAQLSQT